MISLDDRFVLAPLRTAPMTPRQPLLVWAQAGGATVLVDGERTRVNPGWAVLVPAHRRVQLRTDPDAVVFPIHVATDETQPSAVAHFRVPTAWHDRLVFEFIHNLGYLRGSSGLGTSLLDLLRSVGRAAADDGPRMPHHPDLFAIAQRLMEDPDASTTPAQFAASAAMSERTLQRRFLAQTGQTLTEWRHHLRMAAAYDRLARGEEVAIVADRAGYASRSSFTRAFARHHGRLPSSVRDAARGGRPRADLASPTPLPGVAAPPPIPATSTWPRINSAHVAIWVYRGRATVELPGRTLDLTQGDATIVPAGYATNVTTHAGGLLLPLGFRVALGMALSPASIRVTRFEPAAEAALLHHVVATYSALHPPGYPAAQLFDLLATGPIEPHPPRPLDIIELAAQVASAPHLPDPLEALASERGVSLEEARRSVKEQTGLDARTWLRIKKMTHARELLLCGLPIATVARSVGYAHASSFSRAFTAVHGQSPQALVSEDRETSVVDARRTAKRPLAPVHQGRTVRTCEETAPGRATQGPKVRTCEETAPSPATQGRKVRTCEETAPSPATQGRKVRTCEEAAPGRPHQGPKVHTCEETAPGRPHQGPKRRTCGEAAPCMDIRPRPARF